MVGSTHGEPTLRIAYDALPGERLIEESEVVLWLALFDTDETWKGTKALLDTDDNRQDASRAVSHTRYENRPSDISVHMEGWRTVHVLGEPLPIEVVFSRDAADSIPVWSDLNASHFDILANDELPLKRTGMPAPVAGKPSSFFVGPCRRAVRTAEISGWYDWLAGRDVRTFTVAWRGAARIGYPDAKSVEFVAGPTRFTVRDPAALAWGAPTEGLACGLAALRDTIEQGSDLTVHLGLRFDPESAPDSLGVLNEISGDIGFTLTNTRTGESMERRRRRFPGPGPIIAQPDDFVRLRNRPVVVHEAGAAILTPKGEQLPEGTYSVTAWYENDGGLEFTQGDLPFSVPFGGPSALWKGKVTSEPVRVHIRHAEPMPQEVRVNSTYVMEERNGRIGWGLSADKPIRVTIARRPGYFVGRKYEESFAIGDDAFRAGTRGWGGSIWDQGGCCLFSLSPEEEARIRSGERLVVRRDVTVFETSSPPGHLWMPERGDYRVLWQGTIEGELLAGQAPKTR
jgi:hypothetical protein